MYILVRNIAHCVWRAMRLAARVQNQVCEFSGESQSRSLCTSDGKMEIFHGILTFTDGEYTCEM